MRRRTRYSILVAVLVFALIGGLSLLHRFAPPAVARLLPESDAIFFIDFKPIRSFADLSKHPVQVSADYQAFMNATGIQVERDLDRVAFALHRMQDPNGPNGPVAYSEVMQGRFDTHRLNGWFASQAKEHETYAGHEIYTIPVEGRSFRVTTLGYDMVAGSNMPTTEQIHSIIDRYEASASPFSGSSLLSARYHEVPLFSLAWGIGHVGLPFSENGKIQVLGVQLPLAEDTDLVASVSYRTNLHLRIEEIAPSDAEAQADSASLTNILTIVKGLAPTYASTPDDQTIQTMLQSIKVDHHKDRVLLTGTVPGSFLQQLWKQPAGNPSIPSAEPSIVPSR